MFETNSSQLKSGSNSLSYLRSARVNGGFGREFMIDTGEELRRAKLAVSCLVQPLSGDEVLVSIGRKSCHIVAILNREDSIDVAIRFEGDATFESSSGSIALTSSKSLHLKSDESVTLAAKNFVAESENAVLDLKEVEVRGTVLSTVWNEVRTVADTLSLVAKRSIQSLGSSFSNISGVDQRKCQDSISTVDRVSLLRSKDTIISASRDIKIDGERIHMG